MIFFSKTPRNILYGTAILITGLFLSVSSAFAVPNDFPLDDERPLWWDTADATITFEPVPGLGSFVTGIADGTQGYGYSLLPYSDGINSNLVLRLENSENSEMVKNFWLALHATDSTGGTPGVIPDITVVGYGSTSPDYVVTADVDTSVYYSDGWVFINGTITPQPASETFLISYELGSLALDYLEVATFCIDPSDLTESVPVPSALFLFAGGAGFLALIYRRKK